MCSPLPVIYGAVEMTAVRVLLLLLKGTCSEVLSWPENIGNMQTNPPAVSFGGSFGKRRALLA